MEEENVKEGALAEQIGGTHYKGLKIEPVELWAALDLNAFQGSIIKYVMRYKDKNGKQDLLKAKHYIDYIKQFTPKAFTPDTKEAFSDSICPNFALRPIIIGIEPMISITAKSTIPTVIISFKSNPNIFFLICYKSI